MSEDLKQQESKKQIYTDTLKVRIIDELTKHKNIALDAKLSLQHKKDDRYFRALGQMEGIMFAIEYLEKHLP